MDVCIATFTMQEIKDLLEEEGITPEKSTALFHGAVCQRFRPVEGATDTYVEKEDWPGRSSSSAIDQQAAHH